MSQCCGKIPTEEDAGYIALVVLNTVQRYGNIWQGDLGEQMATEHAVKELNLGTERFDKKIHGYDNVFRDGAGKLVIVEAKATKSSGVASLKDTVHGREGSVEWVEYKAPLMCDPTSSFYSAANAMIGEEILRVGAANVEFLVIHIDPESQLVDVTQLR